jgi:hypothetical protein
MQAKLNSPVFISHPYVTLILMMIVCIPGVLLGFEMAEWVNTNLGDPLDASLCTFVRIISIHVTLLSLCFLAVVAQHYVTALLKKTK